MLKVQLNTYEMYKVLHFHYHYMKDIILRSSVTPLSSDLISPFVEETLQRLHKPPPFPPSLLS